MSSKYASAQLVAAVLIMLSVVTFVLLATNSSWVNGRAVSKDSAQKILLPESLVIDDNSGKESQVVLSVQNISEPIHRNEVSEVQGDMSILHAEIEGSLQRFLLTSGTNQTLSQEEVAELSLNIAAMINSTENILLGHHEKKTSNYWGYFLAANKIGEMVEQLKELSVGFEILTGEPVSRFLADNNKLQNVVSRFSQQVNTNINDLETGYVEN